MRRGIILRDRLEEVRLALSGARAKIERIELRRLHHRHAARGVGGEDVAARDDEAVERKARVETEQRGIGGDGVRRQSRSEKHTYELQSLMRISYAVFCLQKKKKERIQHMSDSRQDVV